MAMLFNCTTGAPYKAPDGFQAHLLMEPGSNTQAQPDGVLGNQDPFNTMALDYQQGVESGFDDTPNLVPENAAMLQDLIDQQAIQDDERRTSARREVKKEKQRQVDEEMSM